MPRHSALTVIHNFTVNSSFDGWTKKERRATPSIDTMTSSPTTKGSQQAANRTLAQSWAGKFLLKIKY